EHSASFFSSTEPPTPNDCVHLRAGCKERDVGKNRDAGPSSATRCSRLRVPPEPSLCSPTHTTNLLRNRFWPALIDIGLGTPTWARVKQFCRVAIRDTNNKRFRAIRARVNEIAVANQGDCPIHREFHFGLNLILRAAHQVGEQLMKNENPSMIR